MSNLTGLEAGQRLTAEVFSNALASSEPRNNQFFNAADLKQLLAKDGAVGIRFYPYLDANDHYKVMAVPVEAERLEIASPTAGYVQSEGTSPSTQFDREAAIAIFAEIASTDRFSVYFSQADLMELLSLEGCIGLKIFQDEWEVSNTESTISRVGNQVVGQNFKTLGVIAIGANMAFHEDSVYIRSEMPCPPDCTDDPYYLFGRSDLTT